MNATKLITSERAAEIGLTETESAALLAAWESDCELAESLNREPNYQLRRRTPATGIAWLDALTFDVENGNCAYIGNGVYYHLYSGRTIASKTPGYQRVTPFGGSVATRLLSELVDDYDPRAAMARASRIVNDLRGKTRTN